MKRILIIALSLYAATTYAQQPGKDGFIQLPGGVAYNLAHDEKTGTPPGIGDYVETHMYVIVDGKMIYNSRQLTDNKPVSFVVQESKTKTDIQEVIKLMTAGDSAVIRFSVDSMLKSGIEQLPWMKPNTGQQATYLVKMTNIKRFGTKK